MRKTAIRVSHKYHQLENNKSSTWEGVVLFKLGCGEMGGNIERAEGRVNKAHQEKKDSVSIIPEKMGTF